VLLKPLHRCIEGDLKTDSKAEAIRIATEFMQLHQKHWPGFEGESEVRPMFNPGMGP
jgi:hypothetical protein